MTLEFEKHGKKNVVMGTHSNIFHLIDLGDRNNDLSVTVAAIGTIEVDSFIKMFQIFIRLIVIVEL